MKIERILFPTITALCLTGCGTICNFAGGDPQPFGGLVRDTAFFDSPQLSAPHAPSPFAFVLAMGLGAGELCASGIADTITFPFILLREKRINGDRAANQEDYSKLPVQYSSGGAVQPASDRETPADEKAGEGKAQKQSN